MAKGNTIQGNSHQMTSPISVASWILVLEHAFECVRSTDSRYSRRPPPPLYTHGLSENIKRGLVKGNRDKKSHLLSIAIAVL